MNNKSFPLSLIVAVIIAAQPGCGGSPSRVQQTDPATVESSTTNPIPEVQTAEIVLPTGEPFYLGADLSYVNEMDDCGAEFRVDGQVTDAYRIFADAGANIVRIRLWHNPDWTEYSNLADVKRSIARAKNRGMQVLLDLHYSDTWADPEKQYIPAGWAHLHGDTTALADTVYQYTYDTLAELQAEQLLPELVQVGNEINNEILQPEAQMNHAFINWPRNAELINHGLQAVADFNRDHNTNLQRMLHIAQPENALQWFPAALKAGVTHFDLIGLSYYGKWSTYTLQNLSNAIAELESTYQRDVIVVETSYPWTLENFDQANNVLNADSLIAGYQATPEDQRRYFYDIVAQVVAGGGNGVIVWEPAWVSTQCTTLWGTGSHWENNAFFDLANDNEVLPVIDIFSLLKDE